MTLEKELLDFTDWLFDNNWKLIGDGMCLNSETNQLSSVNELAVQSETLDYYSQDFQVGDVVREKNSGNEVKLTKVDYNKYDREYVYWYEDEEEEEWYGYGDEFEKIETKN